MKLIKKLFGYCDTCHGLFGRHDLFMHLITDFGKFLDRQVESMKKQEQVKKKADEAVKKLFKEDEEPIS